MTILSNLRGWIFLRIVRLRFWLQVRAARKAVLAKNLCFRLLDAEIRFLKPDLLQFGEDENLDLLVEFVARQLTARELLPKLEVLVGNPSAGELIELARKSETISEVIARYHLVDSFFAGLLKDGARKVSQFELARLVAPDVPELDAAAVYLEHAKTIVRIDKLNKELAERSVLKIEFSINAISGGVSLISVIFVVAGFLNMRYYYQRMGVDVSLYFSVGDYLAASVEQIRAGFFAAVIGLGAFVFGARAASLRSKLHHRASARMRQREAWAIGFFVAVTFFLAAYSIYMDKPDFSLIRSCFFMTSCWFANYIAGAFFKNRLAAMSAILGVLIFSTDVGVSAYERSERFLTGRTDSAFRQKIIFKDVSQAVNGEMIGANGAFYFFYSRDRGVTYVVPRDRVELIEIMKFDAVSN